MLKHVRRLVININDNKTFFELRGQTDERFSANNNEN